MIPNAAADRDAAAERTADADRTGDADGAEARARAAGAGAAAPVRSGVHRFPVRVYYEDTDLAGVVYHANYLRFAERGRSEWLRELGIDQARLRAERGIAFAVAAMDARWIAPARFDDLLYVETAPRAVSGARALLRQAVARDGNPLFRADVTVVATGPTGRPTRLPPELAAALREAPPPDS